MPTIAEPCAKAQYSRNDRLPSVVALDENDVSKENLPTPSEAGENVHQETKMTRTLLQSTLHSRQKTLKVTKFQTSNTTRAKLTTINLCDDDDEEISCLGEVTLKRRKNLGKSIYHNHNISVRSVRWQNGRLKQGECVETTDGLFVRIHKFARNHQREECVIGDVFVCANIKGPQTPRSKDDHRWSFETPDAMEAQTQLPTYFNGCKLSNEVVWRIRQTDGADNRQAKLWKFPLSALRRRRSIILKNFGYDNDSSLKDIRKHIDLTANPDTAPLVCRWKYLEKADSTGRVYEHALQLLDEAEVENAVTKQEELRKIWRAREVAPLDDDDVQMLDSTSNQYFKTYTFGDGFCGAGGATCGARQAGLRPAIAFDMCDQKIRTYKRNNTTCRAMTMGVSDFIERFAKSQCQAVDVLHLSPPCQALSPANTHHNQRLDELNTTPLLACLDVIKILRPRVVTMEETFGIDHPRHDQWRDVLIHQLTELGFSVRWSILHCAQFGVPQTRRRFVIVAAAPGEVLPEFPQPTHALVPYDVGDALNKVRMYRRAHQRSYIDEESLCRHRKAPYNPHGRLANTVTCGGADSHHPSGLRMFTVRELLALQTFPLDYKFGRQNDGSLFGVTELRKQIGNAVPPIFAKALYETIVKSLRETDARS